MALEGWISEGEVGLRKWFGDHWKHAVNEDVAAELDREASLRQPQAGPTLLSGPQESNSNSGNVVAPETPTAPADNTTEEQ